MSGSVGQHGLRATGGYGFQSAILALRSSRTSASRQLASSATSGMSGIADRADENLRFQLMMESEEMVVQLPGHLGFAICRTVAGGKSRRAAPGGRIIHFRRRIVVNSA